MIIKPVVDKEVINIHYTKGEKIAAGGAGISIAVGIIAAVGAVLAIYAAAHGIHLGGFFSHIPLDPTGIGLGAAAGGLVLLGLSGVTLLKWREHKSKQILNENKANLLDTKDLLYNAFQEIQALKNVADKRYVVVTKHSQPKLPSEENAKIIVTYDVFRSSQEAQKFTSKQSTATLFEKGAPYDHNAYFY